MSIASTVSEFLEEKIKAHQCDLDILTASIAGLQGARQDNIIDGKGYAKAAAPFIQESSGINKELSILIKQRKLVSEDMENELVVKKRRVNDYQPSTEFYERAYTSTIIPRIMSATALPKKHKFRTEVFRANVFDAYDALEVKDGFERAWCHLSGWWDKRLVKAAHLVPKSLKPSEVAYLFGVQEITEDFFYNWKLGK
jgi:hypothetical protein